MTSTENPEQNEYEESFKRFKTLFIVGAACFCIGVTVVIIGNRFQLYEVQRLGIIFSSFGIGWIVLAISYLVYMKWCFIPGESENTPQQVVERSITREGTIVPRTLGRPHSSSKALETFPRTDEEGGGGGGHSSPARKSYGRSTSLASNLQRSSPSVNGSEKRSLHSSKNFERRSYSVRYFRDRPYRRDCRRFTSSFGNFENPLFSDLEKRMSVAGKNNTPLQRNFDEVPFLAGKPESAQFATTASSEGYFERTSFPEKIKKQVSSLPRNFERPLSELKNSERPSTIVNKSERQPSLVHNSNGERLAKNAGKPSPFLKHFEQPPNLSFETKTAQAKNCEIPPSELENSYSRQLSLARGFERQRTLENCGRQSISMQHSCTCQANRYDDSLPVENKLERPPSVQQNLDTPQSCKIDLDTKSQKSSPPDYYAVVLSLQESKK